MAVTISVTISAISDEERGFQIPQEMPDEVWSAYEELVRLGYDKQLMQ